VWIGWPGTVAREHRKRVEDTLASEHRCQPLFLPEQLAERFYEGFSNRTIWPVFHSFPSYAKYSSHEWEAYQRANAMFADAVSRHARPGDDLWLHDYHLMLLPGLLRSRLPQARLGFFLHIPFPPPDIFRLLPQHRDILQGLLGADLIGFHTHDYAQAFLGSARRLLGLDNTLGQIFLGQRPVQVDVFPMGIDHERYATAPSEPGIASLTARIRTGLRSRRMVFSVSRLDYTKGIPEALEAFAAFLTRYPEWIEHLVYILVVVPSRERVERYASLKREIDEMIGRINGEFGTIDWQPVRSIYRPLSFPELIALYASADVALVTPLRDGMNLIAKEFLAVRGEGTGVLVVSELAGAAKELGEALHVNPNSTDDVAEALQRALTMPEEEQRRRNAVMQQRLRSHNLQQWVSRFFSRLNAVSESARALEVKHLDAHARRRLLEDYARGRSRLLLFDYDGTLVPFAPTPAGARPDEGVLASLRRLASREGNNLVIISGRDRHTLEEWLAGLSLTLVAEHGGWIKERDGIWVPTENPADESWKREIRPIFELFVERIPGSTIEEKTFSLVWHFRQADPESAVLAARELLDTIATLTMNLNLQVLPGNKTLEVRHSGINKGSYFTRHHAPEAHDFILAVGDDWTDEDLFANLPTSAYSVKVGTTLTRAHYSLRTVEEVRSLLESLGV
jgi:trehalose 6-phosphate synthase/phosphatase